MATTAAETRAVFPLPEKRRAHDDPQTTIDRFTRWLTRRSVVPFASLLVICIGLGDLVTGMEIPFTILYMLPVVLAVWFRSRSFAMLLAAAASGCIAASLINEGLLPAAIVWNVIGATGLFVAAIWAIAQLRVHVDRERALRRLAVEQLRHADRLNVIGTLAAGVAHELGTPLSVITGCADFLLEDSNDERVHRRCRIILDQVTKVSAIIRHLLDFGRRGGVERSRIDVDDIVTKTVELLRSTARKRDCAIALEHDDSVFVTGNAPELEQVLSNLIVNAMQAMDHGTVHVRVRVEHENNDALACVEVEDEGCGIPAADLPQIFDPFFTTKGVGEGTGLGLSVSYGIVRDHGGSIDVVSQPGRGSRFTVLLPLA